MLRSHEDAADTAQETLIAYLLARKVIIDRVAWVRTTARNLAAKVVRRRSARWRLELLLGPSVAHDAEDDTIVRLVTEELLDALPARERQAMECWLNGLARAEIAAEMHIGTETVKTHLERARRKLRALITEGGS